MLSEGESCLERGSEVDVLVAGVDFGTVYISRSRAARTALLDAIRAAIDSELGSNSGK